MHNPVFHGALQQHLQQGPSCDGCSAHAKQGAAPWPQLLAKMQPSLCHRWLPLESQILNAEHDKGAPASPWDKNC